MTQMLLGLLIVLAVHSVRLVADDWRTRMLIRLGRPLWLLSFSLVSVLGLALLVWGFAQVREQPTVIWSPPPGLRHLAIALMALSFILLAAAAVPGNRLKARLQHPLLLAVKTWALAHLLVNGMLAHVLLFGSFLAWSVLAYRAARQHDRREGTIYPAGRPLPTVFTVLAGLIGWLVFANWLHGWMIGIRPVAWW
jgi:uncharacterized membrane protein